MSNCCGRIAATLAGVLAFGIGHGADLKVRVVDRTGHPLAEVVVAANPLASGQPTPPLSSKPAVMDQIDQQFVPHILVVQAGTAVAFPNSDTVSHQVYSFSQAKRFQLSLYRGHAHPPLMFAEPGVVVLGCNIHDGMIGYIYVAPGPHFGKTDNNGQLSLKDLADGSYQVIVWHPRFNESQAQIERAVKVGTATAPLEIRLTRELRPELRSSHHNNDY